MLENVLWKAAYTDLTRYMNTLEWLEHLAEDRISEHREEHVISAVWHALPSRPLVDVGQLPEQL
ncbi:hypothetical protein Xbed_03617 [Xenorhabdus beddingii]|uniref:Uncharacterized protein n=2 Tax=Xenorhabdus beddingii TaxID=40578 RepID=A0A1Y2SB47_9GAMM|nr:hypothetical protein Xbed_03617 [Xenorhabdus beddingii]